MNSKKIINLKPNDVVVFGEYISGPITGVVLDKNDSRIPTHWYEINPEFVTIRWSDNSWSTEAREHIDGLFLYVGDATDPSFEQIKFTFALRHGYNVQEITIPNVAEKQQ